MSLLLAFYFLSLFLPPFTLSFVFFLMTKLCVPLSLAMVVPRDSDTLIQKTCLAFLLSKQLLRLLYDPFSSSPFFFAVAVSFPAASLSRVFFYLFALPESVLQGVFLLLFYYLF